MRVSQYIARNNNAKHLTWFSCSHFQGDQAEIVFTLIGEPPFTFTYQRSEPSPKKGGKPGKVLETHTVSRINTHEYSVFSALEGLHLAI